MAKAGVKVFNNWCVLPLLSPHNGDLRRNQSPYFIGNGMSMTELQFCQYVKRELEKRGIVCYVELISHT